MGQESVSANAVSPVPFGIGSIVEGSERTLRSEPEFNENGADDETYEADVDDSFSRASSRTSVCLSSDEPEEELEESQKTQSASNSAILLQDSSSYSQSLEPKLNMPVPRSSSLVLSEPPCTNQFASSQILSILNVHSGMVLFPVNEISNSESSSISAILPTDSNSYGNISAIEPTTSNKSLLSLALQTDVCSPAGRLISPTIDIPRTIEPYTSQTSRKLHVVRKYVKVPSNLINRLSEESENSTDHISGNSLECIKTTIPNVIESGKSFKEKSVESEENKSDGKHKLHTASLNLKRHKCLDKVSCTPLHTVHTSVVPGTPKHSGIYSTTNFKSDSSKERELATQTISTKKHEDEDPVSCLTCKTMFCNNHFQRKHSIKHLQSSQNVGDMTRKCEKCPETFNSIKKLEIHMKIHCSEKQSLKCSRCNRKFRQIWQLKRHETSHSDRFTCEHCGKQFTYARYLDNHKNRHNRTHVCDICNKTYSTVFNLEKHRSKFHACEYPDSNLKVSKVVSLMQEEFSDLHDSSEEGERSVDLCGQHQSSINNEGTQNIKLLENSKSEKNKQTVTAPGKAERVSGISKSQINPLTDHEDRTSVKVYVYGKTASSKQHVNNIGAKALNSEITKECGIFGRDELSISPSKYNTADGNKFKSFKALKDSTKQISTSNESTGIKLHVTENSGTEVASSGESLDTPQVNTTNGTSRACNECLFESENIDDLMTHEQTVHSKVKVYSCIGCLKMFTYQSYLNDHKKLCIENQ